MVIAVVGVGLTLLATGRTPSPTAGPATLGDIAVACDEAAKATGVGTVLIENDLEIVGEDVVLSTPCVVHLVKEAHLSFRKTRLRSAQLVITDSNRDVPPDGSSTPSSPDATAYTPSGAPRLRIEDSTLTAEAGGLLFVRFLRPGGSIVVRRSTLDYPLGINLLTSDTNASAANDVVFSDSTLRSVGPDTEGILVSAAGFAEFTSDRFETTAEDGYALLVADRCQQHQVSGAIGSSCFPGPGG